MYNMKRNLFFSAVIILFFTLQSFAQIPTWEWARNISGNTDDNCSTVTTDQSGNVYFAGDYRDENIIFGTDTFVNTNYPYARLIVSKYDASGNFLWARAPESSDGIPQRIVADNFGNIYVAGYYYASNFFFNNCDTLPNTSQANMFVVKLDTSGNCQWERTSKNSNLTDWAYGLAADHLGNIYVTGSFYSPYITFGNDTIYNTPGGGSDIFIVKYDDAGNVLWAKSQGGLDYEMAYCATDNVGNLFIAGPTHSNSIIFGNDTLFFMYNSMIHFYVAKYDSSGNNLWARGNYGPQDQNVYDIATDPFGNVIITGFYRSPSLISDNDTLLNQWGGANIFVIKYNGFGNTVWTRGFVIDGDVFGSGLCSDNQGNLYVSGYYESSNPVNIDPGALTLPPTLYFDIFCTKYDASGNAIWAIAASGDQTEWARCAAVDSIGNVYIAGEHNATTLQFGTTSLSTSGQDDVFIARIGEQPVGSKFKSLINNLSIYPNPANDISTVYFKEPQKSGNIVVSDIVGKHKAIYKLNNSQQVNIDINTFESGVYLINIYSEKISETHKLIKY